jgi:hypothetical protein
MPRRVECFDDPSAPKPNSLVLLIAVIGVIVAVVVVGWRILRFEQRPSIYPPPPTAVSTFRSPCSAT